MAGDRGDLRRRFHGHLHDVWGRLARSVPGGWVDTMAGLRCIATASPSPSFNLALTADGLSEPAAALDAAHDRFAVAGLPWLLKLQPELDEAVVTEAGRRGLELEEEPVYVRPLWAEERGAAPAGPLELRIADHASIEDSVDCFAAAFGVAADEVRRELGANLLTVPTFTVFVGYLSGEPVATAMLATTRSVGLAGVYSVGTRPDHRGHGFGIALTAAALRLAREQGYDTAVLEPSPSGAAMYRRMGFEPLTTTLEAVITPDAPGEEPAAG